MPPAAKADTFRRMNSQGLITVNFLGPWLDIGSVLLCHVQRGLLAQTTRNRGDSPRTLWGASSVWPQFRFFPFRAALGAGGGGGTRFQAGARVLDRTGPDKGWYSRHSQPQGQQFNCSPWGEFRGWAAAGFFFVLGSTA